MDLLKKIARYLLIGGMLLGGALVVYVASAFFYDDVSELKKKNPTKTAFMTHREIQWEFKGLKNKKIHQVWVPLSKISPYAAKAVLIAEDDKFYAHEGFDFEAMQKAIEKDIKLGKLKYGGSTISQQLAKNLFLSPSKNPLRKAKEVILTWRLENNLSKRRILEIYLNVAEWGDGIFGIEAASRHYFGKSAAELAPDGGGPACRRPSQPAQVQPHGHVEVRGEAGRDRLRDHGETGHRHRGIRGHHEGASRRAAGHGSPQAARNDLRNGGCRRKEGKCSGRPAGRGRAGDKGLCAPASLGKGEGEGRSASPRIEGRQVDKAVFCRAVSRGRSFARFSFRLGVVDHPLEIDESRPAHCRPPRHRGLPAAATRRRPCYRTGPVVHDDVRVPDT